jgi:hypothetical protein
VDLLARYSNRQELLRPLAEVLRRAAMIRRNCQVSWTGAESLARRTMLMSRSAGAMSSCRIGAMRKLIVQQWVTVDNIAAEEDGGLSFVSGEPFSETTNNAFKASVISSTRSTR